MLHVGDWSPDAVQRDRARAEQELVQLVCIDEVGFQPPPTSDH
jgi:hypothetical protein